MSDLVARAQELLARDHVLPLLVVALAAFLGWLAAAIGMRLARAAARRAGSKEGGWFVERLRRPARLLVPALAVRLATPTRPLPDPVAGVVDHAVLLILIISFGWALVALTGVLDLYVHDRYPLDQRDNLRARRIHTRFRLLRRVVVAIVAFLTLGGVLLTFPTARAVGAGLFASAGIVGIAVGIAARPTLETLLASVQMALTEPINIDDVVIVEGEWGRIEEIRATYVVVRIWDLRRLVVPIRYFIDKAFQNWTRVSADLLGAVTVNVDYRTPVGEVRTAVERIVEGCEGWNGEFWNLQVVDAGERTLQLRVLVSASDSGNAWDLRCQIREALVAWLQEHHPDSLPRIRAEVAASPGGAADSSEPTSPDSP